MRTATTWAAAVAMALGVSGSAWAQHGAGSAPAATPATSTVPAPVAHVSLTNLNFHQGDSSAKTGTHTTHSGSITRTHRSSTPGLSTQGSSNGRNSGGLGGVTANAWYGGYNYPLGAIDFGNSAAGQDLAIKALIDPVTEAQLALAAKEAGYARGTSFVPVYWGTGGYYAPDSSAAPQDDSNEPTNDQANNADNKQQPQIIVLQPSSPNGDNAAQTEAAPEPQPKLPDVGEFTLVFKDGKKAAAVAYTRQGDRIVYVTKDGARHFVDVDDIDLPTTQRVNEASGASFQL
ncbi:MAG: hypothetical protein WB869_04125 [Candidatus Acidiferrales bacterium]